MLLFILGILIPFCTWEPRIKVGDNYIYCNPGARINSKRIYHLRIWDYNWQVKIGHKSYQQYLKQAITDFQQLYPNIIVEITFLDFFNGPSQLEQALKNNAAPDLYCSAYSIPNFNYKRQIPIGPFLKKSEKESYFPAILNLLNYKGVVCYFPRWITPELWIGNRELIEKKGLSVTKIQKEGWTWADLENATRTLNKGEYILVGNFGSNGLYPQLIANCGVSPKTIESSNSVRPDIDTILNFISSLKNQNSLPSDFNGNIIGRFLDGKTMLLAGVKPLVFNYLKDKLKLLNKNWEPVFLPVPARVSGKERLLVECGVICIYRNKKTAGDDHLVAAVKLGQFLSSYSMSSSSTKIMFIPCSKETFLDWLRQSGNNNDLFSNLMLRPIILNNNFPAVLPDKISSVLNEFMTGKINAEQAKIKIIAEL